MAGPRISDKIRGALIEDARRTLGTPEGSFRRLANRHNVSEAFARNVVRDAGLSATESARAQSKSAAMVHRQTAAQIRAELAMGCISLASEMRAYAERAARGQIEPPLDPYNQVKEFAASKMPTAQQAAIIMGIMIDKHKILDQYDSDAAGVAAVDSWLKAMTGGQ